MRYYPHLLTNIGMTDMHKDFMGSKIFKDAIGSGLNILNEKDGELTFEKINEQINCTEEYSDYSECNSILCEDDNNSIFEFMGLIVKCENDNSGTLYTDISDSFRVANTVHYFLWESVANEIMNDMEIYIMDILDDEQIATIIEKLESFL